MSNLPSVTLVKKHITGDYYDYIGRVEVRPNKFIEGSSYVVIVNKDSGKKVCEIDKKHEDLFLEHEGKVVSFRGIFDKYHGVVIPHIK